MKRLGELVFLGALALRNDDAYRSNLVAWARSAFPTETNLWVAAQVGPKAFLEDGRRDQEAHRRPCGCGREDRNAA